MTDYKKIACSTTSSNTGVDTEYGDFLSDSKCEHTEKVKNNQLEGGSSSSDVSSKEQASKSWRHTCVEQGEGAGSS